MNHPSTALCYIRTFANCYQRIWMENIYKFFYIFNILWRFGWYSNSLNCTEIWCTVYCRIYQHVSPDPCQHTGDDFKVCLYEKITAGSVIKHQCQVLWLWISAFTASKRLCYIASDAPVKRNEVQGSYLGQMASQTCRSGCNLTDRRLDPPQSHITFHLAWVSLVWCGQGAESPAFG